MKILIIGGCGGIGSAILQRCQQRYPSAELHATYRHTKPQPQSSDVTWYQVDVSNESQVHKLSEQFTHIDWIINCVGFLHNKHQGPALNQVEIFQKETNISGLIITKLDGTAKGGIVVAIAQKYGIPLHAVGVGETAEDLHDFSARDFAHNLVGLETSI